MLNQSDKLLGLEGLRFGAALIILIWHYQHFSFVGTDAYDFAKQEQPFYDLLNIFYTYGWGGFNFFGFLADSYLPGITRRELAIVRSAQRSS